MLFAQAFAEFDNGEEARRALSRDRAYMGDRFIKLIRVPRSEMEQQLSATGPIPPPAPIQSYGGAPQDFRGGDGCVSACLDNQKYSEGVEGVPGHLCRVLVHAPLGFGPYSRSKNQNAVI